MTQPADDCISIGFHRIQYLRLNIIMISVSITSLATYSPYIDYITGHRLPSDYFRLANNIASFTILGFEQQFIILLMQMEKIYSYPEFIIMYQ